MMVKSHIIEIVLNGFQLNRRCCRDWKVLENCEFDVQATGLELEKVAKSRNYIGNLNLSS